MNNYNFNNCHFENKNNKSSKTYIIFGIIFVGVGITAVFAFFHHFL